ncbi:MAG TPA: DNA gyrase inhibitor YacG [Parvularculaceae bacterium]|nr:DNA gyrase inhibitor YacG [Parvularculaceae bacterium]
MISQNDAQKAKAACPICTRPAAADYAPFCSKRCADVDLHRWLSGGYAIPAVEEEISSPTEVDEQ